MMRKEYIAEIYELYNKELYIYIYRFTRSHETSEDILQDTFHNFIVYSRDHSVDKERVKAFLYRTAHNLCINYLKRKSLVAFSKVEDAGHISGDNNAINKIESQELEQQIYKLLEKTDPLTRSIFIMKKEQNMDIEKIAKYTGKSVRTVRRRLHKLLSYMSAALKEGGFILLFLGIVTI